MKKIGFILLIFFCINSLYGENVIMQNESTTDTNEYVYFELANLELKSLHNYLEEKYRDLILWSQFQVMEELLAMDAEGSIFKLLKNLKFNYPEIADIFVFDKSKMLIATPCEKYRMGMEQKDIFNDVNYNKIGKIHYNEILKQNIILLTTSIISKNDTLLGYIVIAIDVNYIVNSINFKINNPINKLNKLIKYYIFNDNDYIELKITNIDNAKNLLDNFNRNTLFESFVKKMEYGIKIYENKKYIFIKDLKNEFAKNWYYGCIIELEENPNKK